jgi:hypothetical protein
MPNHRKSMHAGIPSSPSPDARPTALNRVAAGVVAGALRRRARGSREELAIVERATRRMVLGRRPR